MGKTFGVVGLLIAATCVLIIGFLVIAGTGADKRAAEKSAQVWASEIGIELKGVSCVKVDSDGDGYVSCSVRDASRVYQIECAGLMTINSGCRQPKFRTNQP